MASDFVHLHLHTQYSLLDGAIRPKALFKRITQMGMDAVAVTDNGNMYGAVDFYLQARKAGVKPILGVEIHVCEDMDDKSDRRAHHIVLLCENLEGYQNLCYLVSEAHLRGFYYVPRIDRKLLREHSAGLFGLSACLGGVINRAWREGGDEKARSRALEYKEIFAPGRFFLEVIANGNPEQDGANARLKTLGAELDIPLVATADCHYMDQADAKAHDVLMAVQTRRTVEDPNRPKHPTDQLYLKTAEEMAAALPDYAEALANTRRIAEACDVELDLSNTFLPQYEVPEGYDIDSYFEALVKEGLDKRMEAIGDAYPFDRDAYNARRDYELSVIHRMGFAGYFLIVWDFIAWAKEHGIPVGPGRGSGAGSIVAWALRITDLDPIRYNLLFERFLNPERISMPDFDIDFCERRRGDVIEYVTQKYGEENVGKIATFGSLKAKAVIKAVGRALGLPFADSDRVSKLVPDVLNITLKEALEQEPRLHEVQRESPIFKELIEYALVLEGLYSHTGVHAAGVVIGGKPLWHYTPLCRGADGERVTQYDKDMVEKVGLVKFDFLGLSTLTIIDGAMQRVNRKRGADAQIDIAAVSLEDPDVYKMIAAGDTGGIFQLESSGFQQLLVKMRPDCFEDIVASVALYRPGPLQSGVVDLFIDSKHGRIPVSYPHPSVEEILQETYGVIVYQEQVMRISQAMGGFSQGEADTLRKAMGKKIAELMAELREKFVAGAKEKGIDETLAVEVADLIEKFGGYGFNKSHSAAYALVTYQTAWLKTHHPREFYASLLTIERDSSAKLARYIGEARKMGIPVLPPSVNESELEFSVVPLTGEAKAAVEAQLEKKQQDQSAGRGKKRQVPGEGAIRFGLAAVKNVGEGAVEAIIECREEGGPFTGLFEFCERVDLKRVNKRVVESLVRVGAFDFCGRSRKAMFDAIATAFERGQTAQKDRKRGQGNLFGLMAQAPDGGTDESMTEPYEDCEEWSEREFLGAEKQLCGVFITRHPLQAFARELERYGRCHPHELLDLGNRGNATLVGQVTGIRERPLKNGSGRMAILEFEDLVSECEAVCYARVWAEIEETVRRDEPIILTGRVRVDGGEDEPKTATLIVGGVELLSDVRRRDASLMELRLQGPELDPETIPSFRSVVEAHRGEVPVIFRVEFPDAEAHVSLPADFNVEPCDELIVRTNRLFGDGTVVFR